MIHTTMNVYTTRTTHTRHMGSKSRGTCAVYGTRVWYTPPSLHVNKHSPDFPCHSFPDMHRIQRSRPQNRLYIVHIDLHLHPKTGHIVLHHHPPPSRKPHTICHTLAPIFARNNQCNKSTNVPRSGKMHDKCYKARPTKDNSKTYKFVIQNNCHFDCKNSILQTVFFFFLIPLFLLIFGVLFPIQHPRAPQTVPPCCCCSN